MDGVGKKIHVLLLWFLLLGFGTAVRPADCRAQHRHYDFFIRKVNVTRLCREKSILTVNGQFPGPTIYARRGDVVVVNVHNHGDKNITIHWHGVDQPRNPWADGPEYITQCPIQPGGSFAYRVILSQEEGTLWWHAHNGFDRATVHGAIVIRPKHGDTYPFDTPVAETIPPIILGEWWKDDDPNALFEDARRAGGDVKPSDANTINGLPGDLLLSPAVCSGGTTFTARVESGRTYLLRLVNAGLSDDMFFSVAGHRLTVVATDASYTKPFATGHVMLASGQTADVLLEANNTTGRRRFYMVARTFASNTALPFNNSTATAVLEYADADAASPPEFPADLPAVDDARAADAYTSRLRSLASRDHPVDVPTHPDERMVVAMAVNLLPCNAASCSGPNGFRVAASLNNVSFATPSAGDILRAYYDRLRGRVAGDGGVYETGFPDEPPSLFNFTDPGVQGRMGPFTERRTKVKVLEYGAAVEVVFQDTAVEGTDGHPMHLHGYSFYVVGRGTGNFDEGRDPAGYNLVDPPQQNTVSVPRGGWAAVRFRATNPGVWFMHCHFDRHMLWGMNTVLIVKDGKAPHAKMLRPPPDMPKC